MWYTEIISGHRKKLFLLYSDSRNKDEEVFSRNFIMRIRMRMLSVNGKGKQFSFA